MSQRRTVELVDYDIHIINHVSFCFEYLLFIEGASKHQSPIYFCSI